MIKKIKKLLAKKQQQGFTLIELILYISLLSIFLSGAIIFAWDVIYSREKAHAQRMVNQSASTAMMRIDYEIRNAETITSITPTQLVLSKGGSTTTFNLNGTTLEISQDGSGPFPLTSNQTKVTNLVFSETNTSLVNTKGVTIDITLEQTSNGLGGSFDSVSSIKQSVELYSQHNQAQKLIVDLTNITIDPSNAINGITLENSGTNNIVIDQIFLEWFNLTGTENITGIQIDGNPVEWTGSSGNNTTIDISDFNLTPAAGIVDLTYLEFDAPIYDGVMRMNFILSDGSVHKTEFTLPSEVAPSPSPTVSPTPTPSPTVSPTPTASPTPTPTPPPIDSCTSYCASLATNSSGTCRNNPNSCSQNGETHQSGGDIYCTGGKNADTCCCAP
jgi:prepilin-type N-terminal cleavage/methylation domain-containing protein